MFQNSVSVLLWSPDGSEKYVAVEANKSSITSADNEDKERSQVKDKEKENVERLRDELDRVKRELDPLRVELEATKKQLADALARIQHQSHGKAIDSEPDRDFTTIARNEIDETTVSV
jgi:TolA-binding protein